MYHFPKTTNKTKNEGNRRFSVVIDKDIEKLLFTF